MQNPPMANPYLAPPQHAAAVDLSNVISEQAQTEFLSRGGSAMMALQKKFASGEIPRPGLYVHQEYPKALNLSLGVRQIDMQTETIKGATISWTERREVTWPAVVQNEAEEAEVLGAFDRAEELDVEIDPAWSAAQFLQIVQQTSAAAKSGNRRPLTADERKSARIAELQAELAALTGDGNPVAAREPPAKPRRPHRRTRPLPPASPPEAPHQSAESTPVTSAA